MLLAIPKYQPTDNIISRVYNTKNRIGIAVHLQVPIPKGHINIGQALFITVNLLQVYERQMNCNDGKIRMGS